MSKKKRNQREKNKRLFPDFEPWSPGNIDISPAAFLAKFGATKEQERIMRKKGDNLNDWIPAGYTYLGQFVAHDISFDPNTLSSHSDVDVDKKNIRTPTLDLDSIYGGGPLSNPIYYNQSQNAGRTHFFVHKTSYNTNYGKGVIYDFPRRKERGDMYVPFIPDLRNDENIFVSQLQIAIQLFHNEIVDRLICHYKGRLGNIQRSYFKTSTEYFWGDSPKETPLLSTSIINRHGGTDHLSTTFNIAKAFTTLETKVKSVEHSFFSLYKSLFSLSELIHKIWSSSAIRQSREGREDSEGDAARKIARVFLKKVKKESRIKAMQYFFAIDEKLMEAIFLIIEDEDKVYLKRIEKLRKKIFKYKRKIELKHQVILHILLDCKTQLFNQAFFNAQRIVRWHFQWIIIHDYLPKVAGHIVVNELTNLFQAKRKKIKTKRKIFNWEFEPFVPIEFSTAFFRFGHSMVKDTYVFTSFQASAKRLFDVKKPFQPPLVNLEWKLFFNSSFKKKQKIINDSFSINIHISEVMTGGLRHVEGSKNIVYRNLERGRLLDLPSGQSIARYLKKKGLNRIVVGHDLFLQNYPTDYQNLKKQFLFAFGENKESYFKDFLDNSPLWFYVLLEAHVLEDGVRLGPVCGRIVAEVLIGIIEGDKNSFLYQQPDWKPDFFDDCEVETPGDFTMVDLLKIAGVWEGAYVKEKDDEQLNT